MTRTLTARSFETINLDALRRLPVYTPPVNMQLQANPGNGCFMDAPGYPTYFTRTVYTSRGNTPTTGAQQVITFEGLHYVTSSANDWDHVRDYDSYRAKIDTRLRRLWTPLPYEHPRVQTWEAYAYSYFAHCYMGPSNTRSVSDCLIYPVPSYKLAQFRDDPRFSEDWRTTERAAIAERNAATLADAATLATPERHLAYQMIKTFYPDAQPRHDYIENPPRTYGSAHDPWEV